MKKLILAAFIVALIGCGSPSPGIWTVEYRPMTQEERDAVDRHVQAVLCATKRDLTISGRDQDWDDYAKAVYDEARKSLCKPRLFEHTGDSYYTPETGNYRDFTPATR